MRKFLGVTKVDNDIVRGDLGGWKEEIRGHVGSLLVSESSTSAIEKEDYPVCSI